MQLFIAHCNAMRESHQVHPSASNQPDSILHPATTRSHPATIMTNQPADPPVDTSGYPSPLNTQFLSQSGNYNQAATGVPWFKSSLFNLLPFLQKTHVPSTFETRTAYPAHFPRTTQNNQQMANNPRLLHVHVLPIQARPKSLPPPYRSTPYSTQLPHDPLSYQDTRTILSSSHTAEGNNYCPPWPPPHNSSGFPAFCHSVDPTVGYLWPNNHDPRPIRPVSQASYCFYPKRSPPPLQHCTLYSHHVTEPTSLTEDKNLLRPP